MADEQVKIKVGVDASDAKAGIGSIKKQMASLEKTIKTASKISAAGFLGLTGAVTLAVKEFAAFDNSMRGVKTLLDKSSFATKSLEDGFSDMSDGVLEVSKALGVDLATSTKALFDLVSAGISADDAIASLTTASKLAIAGLTDVAVATDGLTSAINAYGLGAEDAESIAAKLFTTQKFGKLTVESLSQSMGLVIASAKGAGVSLDELLASTASLTLGGIKTEATMTGLKAAIANIQQPTADAKKVAKEFNLEIGVNGIKAAGGWAKFLEKLRVIQEKDNTAVKKLFGSVEAYNVVQSLTSTGTKTFTKVMSELGDETKTQTTFQKAFTTQIGSVENQAKKAQARFKALTVELGSRFEPITRDVLGAINDLMDEIKPEDIDDLTTAIIAATAALGGVFVVSTTAIIGIKAYGIASTIAATGIGVFTKAVNVSKIAIKLFTTFLKTNPITFIGITAATIAMTALTVSVEKTVATLVGFKAVIDSLFPGLKKVETFVKGTTSSFLDFFDKLDAGIQKSHNSTKKEFKKMEDTSKQAGKSIIDTFNEAFEASLKKQKAEKELQKLGKRQIASVKDTQKEIVKEVIKGQKAITAATKKGGKKTEGETKETLDNQESLYDSFASFMQSKAADFVGQTLGSVGNILSSIADIMNQEFERQKDISDQIADELIAKQDRAEEFARDNLNRITDELGRLQDKADDARLAALEKRIAKEKEALENSKNEKLRIESELNAALAQQANEADNEQLAQLNEVTATERAILDHANSEKETLERNYRELEAQLFFETDEIKRAELQASIEDVKGQIETANANQLRAQKNFDEATLKARIDLGIAEIETTAEKIVRLRDDLEKANAHEIQAQKDLTTKIVFEKTNLGIAQEDITENTLDKILAKIDEKNAERLIAEQRAATAREDALTEADRIRYKKQNEIAQQAFEAKKDNERAAAIISGAGAAAAAVAVIMGSTLGLGFIAAGVAAGAIIASVAAQIIAIDAQQFVPVAFQRGGQVPGSPTPGRDSVPTVLEPGELVVPRMNFDEVVNAVASDRTGGETEGRQKVEVEISLVDEANQLFNAQTIEDRAIGVSAI